MLNTPIEIGATMDLWNGSMVKDIMASVIQSKAPFRQIDGVIMLGTNEILPSGQLNNFMMDTMKELSAFGKFDNIIEDGVRDDLFA